MLNDFISLFFPNYCLACKKGLVKGEELICMPCDYQMPRTDSHLSENNFISIKFFGKIQLQHALAYLHFSKEGMVQHLLHQLKYENKPQLAEYFGRTYGHVLADFGLAHSYDIIVPVPLHRKKQKRRGYNQSYHFAVGLSEILKVPVKNALKRVISTATQTRKSRMERWQNVEHIFDVNTGFEVKGKKILLVDDVITTGATLESCASCLYQAGADAVGVGAIAAAK